MEEPGRHPEKERLHEGMQPGIRSDLSDEAARYVLQYHARAVRLRAEELFPGVITANVKHAKDYNLSTGPDAESARRLTAEKVAEAVSKVGTGQFQPYQPELPMTVTVRMKTSEAAETAARRPGVKRIDEYTVEGHVNRHCDVVKWIIGTGLP